MRILIYMVLPSLKFLTFLDPFFLFSDPKENCVLVVTFRDNKRIYITNEFSFEILIELAKRLTIHIRIMS